MGVAFKKLFGSIYVVIGVVLIWRGVWLILDRIDHALFGRDTLGLAVLGVVVGFVLLYLHDHKIDELGHL